MSSCSSPAALGRHAQRAGADQNCGSSSPSLRSSSRAPSRNARSARRDRRHIARPLPDRLQGRRQERVLDGLVFPKRRRKRAQDHRRQPRVVVRDLTAQLGGKVGTFAIGVPVGEVRLDRLAARERSPARRAGRAADAAPAPGAVLRRAVSPMLTPRLDGWFAARGDLPDNLGDTISPRRTERRHRQRLGADRRFVAIRFASASARRTCLPRQPLRRPGR